MKIEAKQQVLAHLGNFAYDPINYNNLWDFYAVDVFIGKIKAIDYSCLSILTMLNRGTIRE
jgi:hypothetical protein